VADARLQARAKTCLGATFVGHRVDAAPRGSAVPLIERASPELRNVWRAWAVA
jgi:hypothetical protein